MLLLQPSRLEPDNTTTLMDIVVSVCPRQASSICSQLVLLLHGESLPEHLGHESCAVSARHSLEAVPRGTLHVLECLHVQLVCVSGLSQGG